MIINFIFFFILFSVVILFFYKITKLLFFYYKKLLTKEGFIEENDIRCKKEGQVFSDFPPGTYCSGYGKIKIL